MENFFDSYGIKKRLFYLEALNIARGFNHGNAIKFLLACPRG
jgi:hypothetical protein